MCSRLQLQRSARLLLLFPLTLSPLVAQRRQPTHTHSVSNAPLPSARLDMLTRLQSVAVQSGDPAQIASTSRELNVELLSLLSTIAAAENRHEEAIGDLRESLQLHQDSGLQLRLAVLLAREGRSTEAVKLATDVTIAQPNDAHAFSTLGSVLRSAGRDREAATALTRALELDPNPSLAFALGSSLLMAHEKARAEAVFAHVLAGSDGAAIWHVAIGDAYREAAYLSEAAAEFQKALTLDPRATHAEFFLGLVNLQMNEWGPNSESFNHLRRSVAQNPKEYLSNFYLGALESTDGSDLAASDRHLLAAAEADPTQPEVWIYLGQNSNRERNPDQAIAYLKKAVDTTGTDESRNRYQIRRAYFTLGRLLIARGERERGEKYLADYKRTSALDGSAASAILAEKQAGNTSSGAVPPDTTLRNLDGDTAARASVPNAAAAEGAATPTDTTSASPQLRSAEDQLRQLLSASYNDLGTAEARQQQYEPARRDFEQAERFGGDSPALLHNIALVAFRLHDTAVVERSLTEYFATSPVPVDPRSRLMLALADFDLGHFADAASNFRASGDAALADPRTMYSYAVSLARIGQAKEASALADTLVAADLPADHLALVCNVYFNAENYASSGPCYARVARQDPTFRTAHYFVAESFLHLDKPADAIPELHQELALTPNEPNVQSALAFALSQTGHKDESEKVLVGTVTSHPEHADAQYQLGKLLAEQGNLPDALTHLEASVHDDDTKDYAHYQLATTYRKAGRTADAEREFAAYRRLKQEHRNDHSIPQVSATP